MNVDIPILGAAYTILMIVVGQFFLMNLILAVIIFSFLKTQKMELETEIKALNEGDTKVAEEEEQSPELLKRGTTVGFLSKKQTLRLEQDRGEVSDFALFLKPHTVKKKYANILMNSTTSKDAELEHEDPPAFSKPDNQDAIKPLTIIIEEKNEEEKEVEINPNQQLQSVIKQEEGPNAEAKDAFARLRELKKLKQQQ